MKRIKNLLGAYDIALPSGKSIKTQECIELLNEGWILKSYKDSFRLHSFYIFNPNTRQALYFSHGIFNNLIEKGYKAVEINTRDDKSDDKG
jgi:hypothetical protein